MAVSGVLGRKTTSQIGSISHERARERACTGDRSLTPIRYIGETFDQPYMSRTYGPTYSTYMSTFFFFFFFSRSSARFFIAAHSPPHRTENSNAYASTFLLDAKQKIAMIGDRLKFQSSVASRAAISYLSLPRVACRRERCAPRFLARFYLFRNCISMLMSSNTFTIITHTTGTFFFF